MEVLIPGLYWLNAAAWIVVCGYYLKRARHVRSHVIRPLQRAFLGMSLLFSLDVLYSAVLNASHFGMLPQHVHDLLVNPLIFTVFHVGLWGVAATVMLRQICKFDRLDQEVALSGLNDKYRYMIEADPRAILLFHTDSTLIEINRQGRELLQAGKTGFIGRSLREILCYLQPEDPEDLLQHILDKDMLEIKHNDRIYSDFEWTDLKNELGHPMGSMLCFCDVTEEKKFQREIIQSEKLAVVGQLAAATAHEIRNPLTSIKGFLQLLEHRVKGYQHASELGEYTRIMVEEVDRMEKIIRDFLLMTKPSDVTREMACLNSIIERMLVLVQNQAILRSIQLETELSPLSEVKMHKEAIQQVILNLMQNALEAMNIGGTLTIRTHEEAEYVAVQVIDTGIGMTEEEIANLGSPFYSTKTEGTGLGLTVSSKIVREHRGKLEVESEKGIGTTITVKLPKHV